MKLSRVLRILLAAVLMFLLFWFMLPPLNPVSPDFWIFVLLCLAIVFVTNLIGGIEMQTVEMNGAPVRVPAFFKRKKGTPHKKSPATIVALIAGAIILLMALASLIGAPLFNASKYKDLLVTEPGDFATDVAELNMSQIPVVDKDTAERLGLRKLGEMSDLVSQFEVADNYTQINYQGTPTRVTPLVYSDIIKWFNNQSAGIPAYISVNMVTQETTLVRLEEGIKYSQSEYFLRNIDRYLRFHYPTKIVDTVSFEIDEAGTPFWIAPTITYRIGIWSGRDIDGAVLVNAITGESQYYALEQIPTWVDQVFFSNLVIDQLNYNGKYQSGFWNSIFGQRGVLQTTTGYNYIAVGDDVCLYTGMTSVVSDQSNVGFVLVNMRTKETKFYSVPGAEEASAMTSAQGQVQHLGYTATFPLLLNVADRPTYFMSLKDAAGLVKMYAFVDVEQYQVVGTGATVAEARTAYMEKLQADENIPTGDGNQAAGVISEIHAVVLDGNTTYYFRLEGDATVYTAPLSISPELPFFRAGDTLTLTYYDSADGTRQVNGIERGTPAGNAADEPADESPEGNPADNPADNSTGDPAGQTASDESTPTAA